MIKREIFSLTEKIYREINSSIISLVKSLFSRTFFVKIVWERGSAIFTLGFIKNVAFTKFFCNKSEFYSSGGHAHFKKFREIISYKNKSKCKLNSRKCLMVNVGRVNFSLFHLEHIQFQSLSISKWVNLCKIVPKLISRKISMAKKFLHFPLWFTK